MTDKRSSEARWMYADDALDPSGYTASASRLRLPLMPPCLIVSFSRGKVLT
jgi:hypothetical protein